MSEYHLSTPIGVHRLLKKPYDDSEIFYNTENFITYLKNGAGYNGQIVKVLIGKYDDSIRPLEYITHPYMQQFIIHNDSAIPIIKNNILDASNNNILIYNHNNKLSPNSHIDNNYKYAHYVFDNAFYFSLLNDGMLDILNFNKSIDEDSKYFYFKYTKHLTGITDPIIEQWHQLYNPFFDESTISTVEDFDDYCEKYNEIFPNETNNNGILVLHKNDEVNNNSVLELTRYSKQNGDTIVEETINNILMNNTENASNSYRNIRIEMQVSESIKYMNDLNLF